MTLGKEGEDRPQYSGGRVGVWKKEGNEATGTIEERDFRMK